MTHLRKWRRKEGINRKPSSTLLGPGPFAYPTCIQALKHPRNIDLFLFQSISLPLSFTNHITRYYSTSPPPPHHLHSCSWSIPQQQAKQATLTTNPSRTQPTGLETAPINQPHLLAFLQPRASRSSSNAKATPSSSALKTSITIYHFALIRPASLSQRQQDDFEHLQRLRSQETKQSFKPPLSRQ